MNGSNINKIFHGVYKPLFALAIMNSGFVFVSAVAEEMPMKSDSNNSVTMAPMKSASMQGGSAPADARDPHAYSGGYEYRGMAGWEETDEYAFSKVIADQLEYRAGEGNDILRWDIQGWRGTDYNKLWVKFEGENETSAKTGDLELQTLYSRTVSAFWDFQIGARYDSAYGAGESNDRFFAVIGVQGLAPYWFEMEPAIFVSEEGDVSARIVSTYDLLFSQRLILQTRFESNVAATQVREFGIGKGINDVELGLRLRYEIHREIAPYVGVSYTRLFSDTKDLARANGDSIDDLAFVTGIRLWF